MDIDKIVDELEEPVYDGDRRRVRRGDAVWFGPGFLKMSKILPGQRVFGMTVQSGKELVPHAGGNVYLAEYKDGKWTPRK